MNKLSTGLLLFSTLLTAACTDTTPGSTALNPAAATPKNIIFLIGDGMGVEHSTAYRYYADDPATPDVERTIFDELLVGMSSTWPDDDTVVTDSASAATALASGFKSYNEAIGVDANRQPVESQLERAKQLGKQTAIVVTSQINHATPASFIAHNEDRNNYNAIADNYLSNQVNGRPVIDLMLGGGTRYFIREDRNLVEEFQGYGYQYIDRLEQLDELTALPALGLFAPAGLPYAIDTDRPHRLLDMTQRALSLLNQNNDQGFFLMIEGSQIDWCAHANDVACTLMEMDDFAQTIAAAKAFAEQDGETLVIVTADHSTGGLSVGSYGEYLWKPELIQQIHASIRGLGAEIIAAEDIASAWNRHVDFALTDAELAQLGAAKAESEDALEEALLDVVNRRTYTGWTTGGHTAGDVQIFAYGPGAEKFHGFMDNTGIGKAIFSFLNQGKYL